MSLRILRGLLLAGSMLSVVGFAVLGVRQVVRSRPADAVERAILVSADRFSRGVPRYVEPETTIGPALMPGLPYVVSLAGVLFGIDAALPRVLTLAALLAIASLGFMIVRLETGSATHAVASAGFALLGYALFAAGPGPARPEAVMLLLALGGFLIARMTDGIPGALLAALTLAGAYFVDARAAWFVVAAACSLAIDERRRFVVYALAATALIGGGYVALSTTLGPWFNYAAWDAGWLAIRPHPVAAVRFVGRHLLGEFGLPVLASVLSFAMPTPPWRGKTGLWTSFGIAALAAALLSTQSTALDADALAPVAIAFAILGPISIQRIARHLSAWPGSSRLGGRGVVLAALTLQLVVFLSCLSRSIWA
jgi:hypothetical protein